MPNRLVVVDFDDEADHLPGEQRKDENLTIWKSWEPAQTGSRGEAQLELDRIAGAFQPVRRNAARQPFERELRPLHLGHRIQAACIGSRICASAHATSSSVTSVGTSQ